MGKTSTGEKAMSCDEIKLDDVFCEQEKPYVMKQRNCIEKHPSNQNERVNWRRRVERRMMEKFGFKTKKQYRRWKRIINIDQRKIIYENNVIQKMQDQEFNAVTS